MVDATMKLPLKFVDYNTTNDINKSVNRETDKICFLEYDRFKKGYFIQFFLEKGDITIFLSKKSLIRLLNYSASQISMKDCVEYLFEEPNLCWNVTLGNLKEGKKKDSGSVDLTKQKMVVSVNNHLFEIRFSRYGIEKITHVFMKLLTMRLSDNDEKELLNKDKLKNEKVKTDKVNKETVTSQSELVSNISRISIQKKEKKIIFMIREKGYLKEYSLNFKSWKEGMQELKQWFSKQDKDLLIKKYYSRSIGRICERAKKYDFKIDSGCICLNKRGKSMLLNLIIENAHDIHGYVMYENQMN